MSEGRRTGYRLRPPARFPRVARGWEGWAGPRSVQQKTIVIFRATRNAVRSSRIGKARYEKA